MGSGAARAAGLGVALALAACAHGPAPAGDAAAVARLLQGVFDNRAQMAALGPQVARQPVPGGDWVDAQWARLLPVAVPAVPGRHLYLEWRAGGPDGPISRQRLWSLADTPEGPRMAFHTFRDPAAVAGGKAEALARLTPADLISYPEACRVRFARSAAGWTGRIDPADCTIRAQSGRTMALDVTIAVDAAGIGYRERGVLPDGRDAFLVPGHAPYRFVRAPGRAAP